MRDEELLSCPLLRGLDAIRRAELLGLLNKSNLREELEKCLASRAQTVGAAQKSCASGDEPAPPRDFQREVHSWNTDVPMWRRSPKE